MTANGGVDRTMSSKAQSAESREIPDPIKREIRQRCGFGCVLCGHPIYQYHHMVYWSDRQEHIADDITLLCDEHHRQEQAHLLSSEQVATANANPFNRREGVSKPLYLRFEGKSYEVIIGRTKYEVAGPSPLFIPILVDGVPLVQFRLESSTLLLSINLFDRNNELVFQVIDNELLYRADHWDIEFVANRVTIREASGVIWLVVAFEPPHKVIIERGVFFSNGLVIVVEGPTLAIFNCKLENQLMFNVHRMVANFAGFVIGNWDAPGAARIRGIERFPHSVDDVLTKFRILADENLKPSEDEAFLRWVEESKRRTDEFFASKPPNWPWHMEYGDDEQRK